MADASAGPTGPFGAGRRSLVGIATVTLTAALTAAVGGCGAEPARSDAGPDAPSTQPAAEAAPGSSPAPAQGPEQEPSDADGDPEAPVVDGDPGASGLAVPDGAEVATHSARLDDLPERRGPAPVHLRVSVLGVDAPVSAVGVAEDGSGELDVPPDADSVAWYRSGPSPGRPGSAVLAGHVDYDGAEGVFFRLGDLDPGAEVTVGYDDGSEARFTVVERRQYTKAELPTEEVFAADGAPRLTLITCGGSFDPAAGSYRDNIVVEAVPV